MNEVCAVVDAQGFLFKNKFVAREVAIVSDFLSQCQELNPNINWKLLPDDERDVVLYSTKFIHGLHYCPFNPRDHSFIPNSENIASVIETWYDMVATPNKTKIAFKNKNIGDILNKLNIPFVNLDDKTCNFPTVRQLQDKYGANYICAYHKKPPPGSRLNYNCAYRKSNQIYREIKEIQNSMETESI